MSKHLSKYAVSILCGSLLFSSVVLAERRTHYEVTITNLTRAQALTPILVASHRKGVKIFELGSAASDALSALAEGGDFGPLTDALEANDNVVDTANSFALLPPNGLLVPGASVTVTVSARHGAKEISLASMLIPTNDSFIALNGVKAPKRTKTAVYYSPGFDAGSEPNDENCENIPRPVCGGEAAHP